MICKKCGVELSAEDKFCAKCGTPVDQSAESDSKQPEDSKAETATAPNVESEPKVVATPVSFDDKPKKFSFSKKVIAIAGGIVGLIIVAIVAVTALSGSPIDGVSKSIYNEGSREAAYYMSDEFVSKFVEESGDEPADYSDQVKSEISDKETALLAKCKTEEEKAFVRASGGMMRNGVLMALSESLKQTCLNLGADENSDVITSADDLTAMCIDTYQEYLDAKTIEDFEGLASSAL